MTDAERGRFLANIETDADRLDILVARRRDLARAEATPLAGKCAAVEVFARAATARRKLQATFAGEERAGAAKLRMSAEALDIVLDATETRGAAFIVTLVAAGEASARG